MFFTCSMFTKKTSPIRDTKRKGKAGNSKDTKRKFRKEEIVFFSGHQTKTEKQEIL